MTSIETMPGVSPKARAAYKLKVVSFNVQQLLAAQAREGKNQTEMASYLGIKPSGMSLKISRANWRFEEVLLAAEYLDTLLFLQIGVSSRMFALQLVFRRASARNAQ